MNFLKIIFLFIFIHGCGCAGVFAQTNGKPIEGNYCQGVQCESNLVINPSAEKNTLNVTVNNATATRVKSGDVHDDFIINGKGVWLIDSSALNGYVQFDLISPTGDQTSGNCAFVGSFNGDASLYSAVVLDASNNVILSQALTNTIDQWKEFKLNVSCATAGQRKVRIVQTSAGTAPAFYAGRIAYGKTAIAMGTIITEEQDWIPTFTGLGTVTLDRAKWRQVGEYMEGEIRVVAGTTTAVPVTFTLPGSRNTKYTSTAFVGEGISTNVTDVDFGVVWSSATSGNLLTLTNARTGTGSSGAAALLGTAFSSTNILLIKFRVKIDGWTAGARVSDGYDAQDVVLSGTGTSTTAFTTTPTTVTFNTNIKDTTSSYSSGVYTVKSNGSYPVEAQLDTITGTYPAGGTVVLAIYKNSTEVYSSFSRNPTGSSAVNLAVPPKVSGTVDAVVGDTISIKAYGASGLTSFTAGSSTYTYISIFKKSGAAYITPEGRNVTTKGNNQMVARVTFGGATVGSSNCTTNPCTIHYTDVTGATVTRNSQGNYTVSWPSGTFSGAPTCTRGGLIAGTGPALCGNSLNPSAYTSGTGIVCYPPASSTATDSLVELICYGPRGN